MSALKRSAIGLAALQDDLERAAARCVTVAGHADEAFQAATTMGSAAAIGDAEDIKAAVEVLNQQLQRALSTAGVAAATVRTVMHGDPRPDPASLAPPVPPVAPPVDLGNVAREKCR
jgi:hypothetical protein